LKGCHILSLPGAPTCLGQVLLGSDNIIKVSEDYKKPENKAIPEK
jgi:hypothetical protein